MSFSLDASLRTCKVQTGEAQRIDSDRFLNPNNMICVPWNGLNNKGQTVCVDSWYTKSAGCNSAEDRVEVENWLRPMYSDYINLNVGQGLQGDIYGNNKTAYEKAGDANKWQQDRYKLTGSFGNQFQADNLMTCGLNAYENAMSQVASSNRKASFANNGYFSNTKRNYSGF